MTLHHLSNDPKKKKEEKKNVHGAASRHVRWMCLASKWRLNWAKHKTWKGKEKCVTFFSILDIHQQSVTCSLAFSMGIPLLILFWLYACMTARLGRKHTKLASKWYFDLLNLFDWVFLHPTLKWKDEVACNNIRKCCACWTRQGNMKHHSSTTTGFRSHLIKNIKNGVHKVRGVCKGFISFYISV